MFIRQKEKKFKAKVLKIFYKEDWAEYPTKQEFRISLVDWGHGGRFDIRKWYQDKMTGEFKPGRGISFELRILELLIRKSKRFRREWIDIVSSKPELLVGKKKKIEKKKKQKEIEEE